MNNGQLELAIVFRHENTPKVGSMFNVWAAVHEGDVLLWWAGCGLADGNRGAQAGFLLNAVSGIDGLGPILIRTNLHTVQVVVHLNLGVSVLYL